MRSTVRTRGPLLIGIFAVVALSGRCSGGCSGCDALDPIPGGYPMNERIENGAQVRVSESGLDFIETVAPGLVADFMGGDLVFDIPASCDAADLGLLGTIDVCGTGSAGNCTPDPTPCQVALAIQDVQLTPQDPPGNQLDVEVRVNVSTPTPLTLHGTLDCNVTMDTTQGNQAYVRAQTSVTLDPDSGSKRLLVDVADITIPDGDIENDDIHISGGLTCWLANTFFKGMVIGQLTDQINGMVGPMVASSLCMPCDQGETCPAQSTCDGDYCQEDSGEGCVAPFGMEGRMDLGSMMASIAPGKEADLDLHLWAGGYGTTPNNGVSIGMLTGARAPEHNDCVPQRTPPDTSAAPVSTVFQGNERPGDNQPFMVGFGVHKKFLDAAGYAAYDSGALCLDIGPREVDMLTTTTFQLIAASMLDLSHDEEVPVVLAVRPQNPLTFDLSPQSVSQDAESGEYTIDSPLLTVRSTDFAIDFYLLMDYRYVRMFRVLADLAIPVALTVNGDNQLVPLLGDLSDGFENLRVVDSQLLEEDPDDMAVLFPTLLGMAAGFIGDLGAIDLPDLQGFQLVLDDGSITAVDNNTLLAIFADLTYTSPAPKAALHRVRTEAQILERHLPPAGTRIDSLSRYRSDGPAVTLGLGGVAPRDAEGDAATLEWQYRVNGGFWSLWTDSPRVLLRRPEFLLQGNHTIEVRGRVKGQRLTEDRTPVILNFRVDTVQPTLALERDDQTLTWTGHDNLTPEDALEYRFRLRQGAWSDWQPDLDTLQLPDGFQGEYTVQVRDEAGNTAEVTDQILGLYGRVETPPTSGSCGGCAQSNGPAGAAWGVFGLLLLLWIRRRRRAGEGRKAHRRGLPFLLALAVATLGTARCDCGGHTGGTCRDAGPDDLICINADEPCPYGELVPTEPVVLDATNHCQPRPVMCECQDALWPLDPGDYGRFLSIDAQDGSVVVSSYSDRFGDLVVTTLGEQGELVPEAVDGIPDRTPDHDPAGYRGGVSRSGDDVGMFTSVALAEGGTVNVSYVDEETGALKFAQGGPGDWDLQEVEAPASEDAWTYYTELQLLDDDRPAIAFMVTGLPDPATPGGFVGQLRYAVASSATPAGPEDWTVGVVDQVSIPCGDLCPSGQVCVASSWTCQPEDDTCADPCADGEACVAGACVAEYVTPGWEDHPEGVGLYLSSGRLSTGEPVLVYHDRTQGLLRMAVGSDTADASPWSTTTLEGDAYTDIGLYASMVIDASDLIHVSYTDAVHDSLLYAEVDTTGAMLVREVVDDGFRPLGGPAEEHHVVGLDSVVFLDPGGHLHILYQDGTTADLWHAERTSADSWTLAPAREGDPGYGFFVDVAVDTDGTLWVAEYIYDRTAEDLNRMEVWSL